MKNERFRPESAKCGNKTNNKEQVKNMKIAVMKKPSAKIYPKWLRFWKCFEA